MLPEFLDTNFLILSFSIILIISILGTKFTAKIKTPSLLFFIAIGMLIGSDGLGLVSFYNPQTAQTIGMLALVVILFDGGIKTDWDVIRPVVKPAASLATLGVVITSIIIGIAAKFTFGIGWAEAMLMGALVGSTDAAAVFAMLQGKNINTGLASTLEGESGANDPMAVFLTITLISFVDGTNSTLLGLAGSFVWNMGGGLLIGLLVGWLGSKALYRVQLNSSGLYPLHALAFAFLTYSFASLINASGLLAVYTTALVIGNTGLKQRNAILRFNEGFSWIAQIVVFVTLGLFVIPSELFQWGIVMKGILLSIILMFIARPFAVYISTLRMGFNNREKVLLSWAGLRGAVPIVLALFPMIADIEHSQLYFNVIFFVVIVSTMVQGPTLSWVAQKMDVVNPTNAADINHMEILQIGKQQMEILEITLTGKSKATGKLVKEIGLPKEANITFIQRRGNTLSPYGELKLKKEDTLYLLSPKDETINMEKYF